MIMDLSKAPFHQPLVWSEKKALSRMLLGEKSYRDICKQLKERDLGNFNKIWSETNFFNIVLPVSHIIQDEFYWPNNYFFPKDPCEILFWEHGPECSELSAIIDIEKHLRKPVRLKEEFWGRLHQISFLELVDALSEFWRSE